MMTVENFIVEFT